MSATLPDTYTPHAETFRATVAVFSNSRLRFTVDDVLDSMGPAIADSIGAHGGLMFHAARANGLRAVGYVKSRRTGGLITVWSRHHGGAG